MEGVLMMCPRGYTGHSLCGTHFQKQFNMTHATAMDLWRTVNAQPDCPQAQLTPTCLVCSMLCTCRICYRSNLRRAVDVLRRALNLRAGRPAGQDCDPSEVAGINVTNLSIPHRLIEDDVRKLLTGYDESNPTRKAGRPRKTISELLFRANVFGHTNAPPVLLPDVPASLVQVAMSYARSDLGAGLAQGGGGGGGGAADPSLPSAYKAFPRNSILNTTHGAPTTSSLTTALQANWIGQGGAGRPGISAHPLGVHGVQPGQVRRDGVLWVWVLRS